MYKQPKIRIYDSILLKDLGYFDVVKCIWFKGDLLDVYTSFNDSLYILRYDNVFNRLESKNKRYIGYLKDSFKDYHN